MKINPGIAPNIDHRGLRTWIEIDTGALAHNYRAFRKIISQKTRLMAVVKSNAYGHDFVGVSRVLEKLGVDFLGVDSVVEALALRKEGIRTPILVLGYTLPEMLLLAAKENISVTVSSMEQLSHILKLKLKKGEMLKIHIKADTGLHRQGFQLPEMESLIGKIKKLPKNIRIEGLYTHFASAKNPAFPKDTEGQMTEFKLWRKSFAEGELQVITHASATGGTLLFPQAHYDMVRVGIGMYGQWPSREAEAFCDKKIDLKPILSWKSIVSEIKKIQKRERIGYDLTEKLSRDSIVGVVPVGYWHGLPRALSGIGRVLVRGKSAKIIGRISMDMISVDLTEIKNVQAGDTVTIIGADDMSEIHATDISALIDNSSHYEILTGLNPLIKRFFI